MGFIDVKSYKAKKRTFNVFVSVLLGIIILLGNTVSIGYNLTIPKSFAQQTTHNSSTQNPNFQTLGSRQLTHSIGHPNDPFSQISNSDINTIGHHLVNHVAAFTSQHSHPFTHVARPNFATSNSQHANIVTHNIQQHTTPTIDPASGAVPFSGINNALDPTLSFSKSLSDSKSLNLQHSDTHFKVVGPDNFKFIRSYWTTDNTLHAVDVGTSTNSTFLSANPQDPNQNDETSPNEGPTTLAVTLQYEGVVQLSGLTAAMKLPKGFNSTLPLIHNTKRFDIVFSNYIGNIYPGQGVVLYFHINVTSNTKVKPYVAPLALHTLRSDLRTSTSSLDASQQDQFASVLDIHNATLPFFNFNHNNQASSTFTHNYDLTRQYNAINELLQPYDFVNQVIPVTFEVTGGETLVVNVLSPTDNMVPSSPYMVLAPPGVPTKVRILVENTGSAPIYNTIATVTTRDESAIAATVVPSDTNVPNAVQQNAILPMVIVGPTQKNMGFIAAGGTNEIDITIVPSSYVGGTVENLFVTLTFTDVVSESSSKTLPIGVEILPVTGQGALHGAIKVPFAVTTTPKITNPISNTALSAMLNTAVNGNAENNAALSEAHNAAHAATSASNAAHAATSASHGASSGGGAGGGGR